MLTLGIALALLAQPVALRALGIAAIVGAWILPVLYAVQFRARARFRKTASGEDVRQTQRAVVASIVQSQKVITTMGDRQDRALRRVEAQLHALSAISQAKMFRTGTSGIDVLFVTSNGAGLGHVSRLLAIADQLPEGKKYEILTLSSAYRQVAAQGVAVHYFPSSEASGASSALWNGRFRAYLLRLMESSNPQVVVFDGTWVYAALTDICRALGVPLIWVQRGMWRPEVDEASVQRHDAGLVADRVIVPGDYAGDEEVDAGKKVALDYVGPIVRTTRADLLTREEACAELGLDPSRRYVLLNLGGGDVSEPTSLAFRCRELLHEMAPALTPVQVVSPLAALDDEVPGVIRVSAYPVMPNANAFDFMICAAGYNSAQEAVSLGRPSILIPNSETRTDDQVRRARELSAQGLCFSAEDEYGLRAALERMIDPIQRDGLRRRLLEVIAPRGALEAAMILDGVIDHAGWHHRALSLEGSADHGA